MTEILLKRELEPLFKKAETNQSRTPLHGWPVFLGLFCATFLPGVCPVQAGPLDFFRDEFRVPITSKSFGAPPSAFEGFQLAGRTANTEEWSANFPGHPAMTNDFEHRTVQLSFVSNRLEAVQVSARGKNRNNEVAARFRQVSDRKATHVLGLSPSDDEWSDQEWRLTYQGLCSSVENWMVIFRLTPTGGDTRIEQARAARRDGPPVFFARPVMAFPFNGELLHANVSVVRSGGPASDVSFKAPAGIVPKLLHQSTSGEFDSYSVFFKTDGRTVYLPKSWQFSLVCTGQDQKQIQKTFTVAPRKDAKTPDDLEIVETGQ